MGYTVIYCRLIASENILCFLWRLMAQPYSELVKELLEHINTHPDFIAWLDNFKPEKPDSLKIPESVIEDYARTVCQNHPAYQELPGRFRTSAITLVKNIYSSWFAVRRRQLLSLHGKKRFLSILKSDEELQRESGSDLYTLAITAEAILKETQSFLEKEWEKDGAEPFDEKDVFLKITKTLYEAHDKTKSCPRRCAIAYLIKNGNEIPQQPENPETYQLRQKNKEIQIQRLEKQLQGSAPKARLLDDSQWLQTLEEALIPITEVEELEKLQMKLLQKFPHLPYPVFYGTNTDLSWSFNKEKRICVTFNGLKNKEVTLEIACDRRQLPQFQRFLSDYQCYLQHNGKLPAGLMLLRSAHLVWKPTGGKGEPWNTHHLYLHCAVDNRLWSVKGIEQVRLEKIKQTQKVVDSYQSKAKEQPLTANQQQRLKANQISLEHLKTFDIEQLFPSHRASYQGNLSIILGVSIGLLKPVTIAILDTKTKEVLAYRSTKQLLNRTHKAIDKKVKTQNHQSSSPRTFKEISNYELFQNYQLQKHHNKHERHKAQIKFADNTFGEANLGLYLNRLLAQAIVETAQAYQVSLIVLPEMTNIREIIEVEVRARAALKYPGNVTSQKCYAKDFRTSVNQWSYNQLSNCISNRASQSGIEVTTIRQIIPGTGQEKARQIALAYLEKQQKPPKQKKLITP